MRALHSHTSAIIYMTKQARKSTAAERDRSAIEITPAMIEAGVTALEGTQDSSSVWQAKSVFEAMIHTLQSDSEGRRLLLRALSQ
jgi:hypothetical protein